MYDNVRLRGYIARGRDLRVRWASRGWGAAGSARSALSRALLRARLSYVSTHSPELSMAKRAGIGRARNRFYPAVGTRR